MAFLVKQLNVAYGTKHILKDVSFHVEKEEFVSILGPSGSGKSTLLNAFVQEVPIQSGSILWNDVPITNTYPHFAYMPQEDLLLPWRTILDNVCLYGEIHHTKKTMLTKAQKQFSLFGLQGYEDAYPKALSGGMRQRAAFLRTSLCDADILLLDEPFGALDVITRNEMQDWLLQMRKKLHKTIILVTHDIDEAIYLSDRILLLSASPASICKEFDVKQDQKTRDWLYEQSDLRKEIYASLKEHAYAK